MIRKASAVWNGSLKEGKGTISTATGVLKDANYSFATRFEGASILVAGKNFGCGSSREHAVWALADFGFRAVISSSFADIFANNSTKNGFLTVRLTEDEVAGLMRRAHEIENYELTVDLQRCEVRDDGGFFAHFAIDDFVRHCLLNGLDDIGLTLQHETEIAAYEKLHPAPAALQLTRQ